MRILFSRPIAFTSLLTASLTFAFVAFMGFGIVFGAWSEPTSAPPNGNVAAPINVGPYAQEKSGGLIIGTGLNPSQPAFSVAKGLVGIGTVSPSDTLDLVGNLEITGLIKPNGTTGATGQVLTNTGTGMAWQALPASGTGPAGPAGPQGPPGPAGPPGGGGSFSCQTIVTSFTGIKEFSCPSGFTLVTASCNLDGSPVVNHYQNSPHPGTGAFKDWIVEPSTLHCQATSGTSLARLRCCRVQ